MFPRNRRHRRPHRRPHRRQELRVSLGGIGGMLLRVGPPKPGLLTTPVSSYPTVGAWGWETAQVATAAKVLLQLRPTLLEHGTLARAQHRDHPSNSSLADNTGQNVPVEGS